jgi:hypothetical protein
VYQLSIDWTVADSASRTNLQRAQAGLSPLTPSGDRIILHHVLQEEPGPMAEVPEAVHQRGQEPLHGLRGNGESFRNDPALVRMFNQFREDYWQWRASLIVNGGQ